MLARQQVIDIASPRRPFMKGTHIAIFVFVSLFALTFTMRGVVGAVGNVLLRYDLNDRVRPAFPTPTLATVSLRSLKMKKLYFPGTIA